MKIQFIIHADFEQPGAIKLWAEKNKCDYTICRPFKKEPLPDISSFDWLVIMGGPQTPLLPEKYPFLADEIEQIQKALSQNKTILGFCLGAQLIGEALQAPAERSPNREVGVFPIYLTEEGKKDALLANFPPSFPVTHWHNDMPGLASDSKVLAYSAGCPRQIVQYKSNVYGFQCHPEVTFEDIKAMIANCPEDLSPGTFVQTKEVILKEDFSSINNKITEILDRLIKTQS